MSTSKIRNYILAALLGFAALTMLPACSSTDEEAPPASSEGGGGGGGGGEYCNYDSCMSSCMAAGVIEDCDGHCTGVCY